MDKVFYLVKLFAQLGPDTCSLFLHHCGVGEVTSGSSSGCDGFMAPSVYARSPWPWEDPAAVVGSICPHEDYE